MTHQTRGILKEGLWKSSIGTVAVICFFSILPFIQSAFTAPVGMNDNYETTSDTSATCIPEVFIDSYATPWRLCLNQLVPGKDSCAEITISGHVTNDAVLQFNYTMDGLWQYTGIKHADSAVHDLPLRIDLTNDPDGRLLRVSIRPERGDDTTRFLPLSRLRNDRPDTADRALPSNLIVGRMVYSCRRIEYKVVIEERIFIYPRNFRRDPVLNYPELSMFHCGGSVRMPTRRSLKKRGLMFCFYHIAELEELVFDDPDAIMETEAMRNRLGLNRPDKRDLPKKERRPPLISFRALR